MSWLGCVGFLGTGYDALLVWPSGGVFRSFGAGARSFGAPMLSHQALSIGSIWNSSAPS